MSKIKKTYFQSDWLDPNRFPTFSLWVRRDLNSTESFQCKVCNVTRKCSNLGSNALASHKKGPKHLKNMASLPKQNLVSNFLNNIEVMPTEPAEASLVLLQQTSDCTPNPAPQEARVRPPPLVISTEAVTKAELLWAMKNVSSRRSKILQWMKESSFNGCFLILKLRSSFI